jgi:hypothetical protein
MSELAKLASKPLASSSNRPCSTENRQPLTEAALLAAQAAKIVLVFRDPVCGPGL